MKKPDIHQLENAGHELGNAAKSHKNVGSDRATLHDPDSPSIVAHSKVTASSADSSLSSDAEAAGQPTKEQERDELASVLVTEIFKRSPKLSRLLTYLYDKYFSGEDNELKEYSIDVDVLGSDTEFDQQLNADVRVDTHI